MTGSTSRTCPACGLLVLRSHHCRASALVPTNAPAHPAPRQLRPTVKLTIANTCPDHPGQLAWNCVQCAAEVGPRPAGLFPLKDRDA